MVTTMTLTCCKCNRSFEREVAAVVDRRRAGHVRDFCSTTCWTMGVSRPPQPDGSRLVPLGRSGKFAIVDEEDYPIVMAYSWMGLDTGYVYMRATKARTLILLHRFLLQANPGELVDHKNRNLLDNRRSNIRLATHSDNNRNQRFRGSRSGYKGVVAPEGNGKRWKARIYLPNQKVLFLGSHPSAEDAAIAYNQAAIEHFGEFASLNEVGHA